MQKQHMFGLNKNVNDTTSMYIKQIYEAEQHKNEHIKQQTINTT